MQKIHPSILFKYRVVQPPSLKTSPSTHKVSLYPSTVISHCHPQTQATAGLLFIYLSIDLPFLEMSYTWNHATCSHLCLAFFT